MADLSTEALVAFMEVCAKASRWEADQYRISVAQVPPLAEEFRRRGNAHDVKAEQFEAIAAKLKAGQWQPIATAPKDTRVLVYRPRDKAEPVAIRSTHDWCGPSCCPHAEPTHWMPLPPAPESQS